MQGDAPAVLLENVRFRWPKENDYVLDIEQFSMRQGEHVFISGPSGSGKSTLLGLVSGILPPTSGSIWVNGAALHEMSGSHRDIFRGDHIGYIFQQFNLIPYLTILENVLIPCRLSSVRMRRATEQGAGLRQVAEELLCRLDLAPSLWGRPVNRLSIGQQQRVACARALIGQPKLLIADEPTSALDADRRKAFLGLLLEECKKRDTALLFVSHDNELSDHFSRIVRITELNRVSGDIE